jgi:hypothetical protein
MAIQFDCAESGCDQKVDYEDQSTRGNFGGFFRKSGDDGRASEAFVVYLTCAKGHVHRYQVPAGTSLH